MPHNETTNLDDTIFSDDLIWTDELLDIIDVVSNLDTKILFDIEKYDFPSETIDGTCISDELNKIARQMHTIRSKALGDRK